MRVFNLFYCNLIFDIGFFVAPEAIEFLQSEDLVNNKVGVIAVAGKYRTGKSFLLNRILLNKMGNTSGFGVGPTINPCTKVSHQFKNSGSFNCIFKRSKIKFNTKLFYIGPLGI